MKNVKTQGLNSGSEMPAAQNRTLACNFNACFVADEGWKGKSREKNISGGLSDKKKKTLLHWQQVWTPQSLMKDEKEETVSIGICKGQGNFLYKEEDK